MFTEQRSVEAAVSTLPLVWGQGLTAYLDNYEYSLHRAAGQQGRGRADLIVARPEFGAVRSRDDAAARRDRISVLRGRANDQGGLGLWSSSPETAEFATVYAAHFLVEAEGSRPEDSGRSCSAR